MYKGLRLNRRRNIAEKQNNLSLNIQKSRFMDAKKAVVALLFKLFHLLHKTLQMLLLPGFQMFLSICNFLVACRNHEK